MLVIDNDQTVFFDVDDTLVLWDIKPHADSEKIIHLNGYPVMPNEVVIEALKRHKARRHKVVVWSAGGWDWAEEAVKKLGLVEHVDIVMSKPKWMYDDLQPQEWTAVLDLTKGKP